MTPSIRCWLWSVSPTSDFPTSDSSRRLDFSRIQDRQCRIQPGHVGWVIQPARDSGGVPGRGRSRKGVPRALGQTQASHLDR